MDWMSVFPQNSYIEALKPKKIVSRNRASEEVIKLKWGREDGLPIH